MNLAKRKGLVPRSPESERPPEGRRPVPRLASEPVSRFRPFEDRWEPGFLRLPPATEGRPLSWVVDSIGIYFDATAPSELELLLEEGGWESDALMQEAAAGMAALRRSGLSLDNDPGRSDLGAILGCGPDAAGDVVVVDQSRADSTLGFALAGPGRFAAMLHYARVENPGRRIVLVMDPAAPTTGLPGHLEQHDLPEGVVAVAAPVSAASVLARASRLYTVCAHLGFEAAMAEVPVSCFGLPFYSGWGFTDDRLVASRRTRRRSVVEVFAAAYLAYSRYYDPRTGAKIPFAEALALLERAVGAEDAPEDGSGGGDRAGHEWLGQVWSRLRTRLR